MFYYPDGESISAPDPSASAADPSVDKPSVNDVVTVVEANGQMKTIPTSDLDKAKGIDRTSHQWLSRFGSSGKYIPSAAIDGQNANTSAEDSGEGSSRPRTETPMIVEDLQRKVDKQEEEIERLEYQVLQVVFGNDKPASQPPSNDNRLRHDLKDAKFNLETKQARSASLEDQAIELNKACQKKVIMDAPNIGLVNTFLELNPDAVFDAMMSHPRTSAKFEATVLEHTASFACTEYAVRKPNKRMRIFECEDAQANLLPRQKAAPLQPTT